MKGHLQQWSKVGGVSQSTWLEKMWSMFGEEFSKVQLMYWSLRTEQEQTRLRRSEAIREEDDLVYAKEESLIDIKLAAW